MYEDPGAGTGNVLFMKFNTSLILEGKHVYPEGGQK